MQIDPIFDEEHSSRPYLITQGELHDLVRDLQLPNNKVELLSSRLQQWNFLAADVIISKFRNRQESLNAFFVMEDDLVACHNINGLMVEALGIQYEPSQWRLFIDSSKTSLKGVLLHNGNSEPSVPVGYAPHMKETIENIKHPLQNI